MESATVILFPPGTGAAENCKFQILVEQEGHTVNYKVCGAQGTKEWADYVADTLERIAKDIRTI